MSVATSGTQGSSFSNNGSTSAAFASSYCIGGVPLVLPAGAPFGVHALGFVTRNAERVGRPGEDHFVVHLLQAWGIDEQNSHTNVRRDRRALAAAPRALRRCD